MEIIDLKKLEDVVDPFISSLFGWDIGIVTDLIWHRVLLNCYVTDIDVAHIIYNISSNELIIHEFRITEFKVE